MGVLDVAAKYPLPVLNEPLVDTDTESFAKFIRSTVATAGNPPLNQP